MAVTDVLLGESKHGGPGVCKECHRSAPSHPAFTKGAVPVAKDMEPQPFPKRSQQWGEEMQTNTITTPCILSATPGALGDTRGGFLEVVLSVGNGLETGQRQQERGTPDREHSRSRSTETGLRVGTHHGAIERGRQRQQGMEEMRDGEGASGHLV